jgi:hypothetical protein
MATTTTNFGWDIPQSTDLVKDGATAIAALGQDIDTAFIDLKGGTTGQVLAKASGTDLDFSWVAQDDSNAIQNAIVDAKGDIISATAADTPARLAVGANGTVLTADSTTATGLKWATASSGLDLINTTSFSAVSSQSINDVFSTTYDNYLILIKGDASGASADLTFRLRVGGADASGASDYMRPSLYNAQNSSTVANIGGAATSSGYLGFTSNDEWATFTTFFNPFLAKPTFSTFQNYGANYQLWGGNRHALATSYTGITLIVGTGTMTGEVSIYGYRK